MALIKKCETEIIVIIKLCSDYTAKSLFYCEHANHAISVQVSFLHLGHGDVNNLRGPASFDR